MKKIVATIEARMTSSRLPGKVLMEAITGVSMLEFMITRVQKSELIERVVIATTTNEEDQPIVDLCEKMGVDYYRGSEQDVLKRVLEAQKRFNSDITVELTGDCPLIDPAIIDEIIQVYLSGNYDYVSNAHIRSYPDGFDVQVFSTNLLEKISHICEDKYDRENVSSFIYRSGNFKTHAVIAEKQLFWPDLRVTLDDEGDYFLLKNIIMNLYDSLGYDFSAYHVVHYLKCHPELLELTKEARVSEAPYQIVSKLPRND